MPRLEERFWEKVDKTETCWTWKASKHGRGYGLFHTGRRLKKGKMEYAHRVAYELTYGEVPQGQSVCYSSYNTSCV